MILMLMEGYRVGDTPPGLNKRDGTFDLPLGGRSDCIITKDGDVLVVDKESGKLIVDKDRCPKQ